MLPAVAPLLPEAATVFVKGVAPETTALEPDFQVPAITFCSFTLS